MELGKIPNIPLGKSIFRFLSLLLFNINEAKIHLLSVKVIQQLYPSADSFFNVIRQTYINDILHQIPSIIGLPLDKPSNLISNSTHIVGSVASTASSGLTVLTGKNFRKVRANIKRDKPKNVLEGLSKGVSSIGNSVGHSIIDVFRSPFEGAKKKVLKVLLKV